MCENVKSCIKCVSLSSAVVISADIPSVVISADVPSVVISADVPSVADPPVAEGGTPSRVVISWNQPVNDGGSPIIMYQLICR